MEGMAQRMDSIINSVDDSGANTGGVNVVDTSVGDGPRVSPSSVFLVDAVVAIPAKPATTCVPISNCTHDRTTST